MCVGQVGWNWDAISAIATATGTLGALAFSTLALGAPGREARRQRRESTEEILRATDDALEIFESTRVIVDVGPWDDGALGKLQARAFHGQKALEQLIKRPSLTDGAIYTGAGAISLLESILAIKHQKELIAKMMGAMRERQHGLAGRIDAGTPAKQIIAEGLAVVEVTKARAQLVRIHLDEGWIQRRIRHAKRAGKGTRN